MSQSESEVFEVNITLDYPEGFHHPVGRTLRRYRVRFRAHRERAEEFFHELTIDAGGYAPEMLEEIRI